MFFLQEPISLIEVELYTSLLLSLSKRLIDPQPSLPRTGYRLDMVGFTLSDRLNAALLVMRQEFGWVYFSYGALIIFMNYTLPLLESRKILMLDIFQPFHSRLGVRTLTICACPGTANVVIHPFFGNVHGVRLLVLRFDPD
jgi:hypothetical protein